MSRLARFLPRPARLAVALPLLLASAGPLVSHPHVFVDTTLVVRPGADGRPAGIEVTWRYDELYSLLIFEDMKLDNDYDGALTEAELAQLDGFDMQWVEGYAGDLYVQADGAAVPLGPPEPITTTVEGGRIETRHFRPFAAPVPARWEVKAYDPTFYTAYDLTGGVKAPAGCAVAIERADVEAAQARVARELDGRSPETEDFPEVGDAFADTVTIGCGSGS